MITPSSLSYLHALAKAASPGPWSCSVDLNPNHCVVLADEKLGTLAEYLSAEDAAYISAASPDVVLGLLTEVARLNEELDKAQTPFECDSCGHSEMCCAGCGVL